MLIGRLIDSVKGGGGQEAVNQYATWMIGIFVLVGISTFLRSYLFTVAGERIVTRLQERLFQRFYHRNGFLISEEQENYSTV